MMDALFAASKHTAMTLNTHYMIANQTQ